MRLEASTTSIENPRSIFRTTSSHFSSKLGAIGMNASERQRASDLDSVLDGGPAAESANLFRFFKFSMSNATRHIQVPKIKSQSFIAPFDCQREYILRSVPMLVSA